MSEIGEKIDKVKEEIKCNPHSWEEIIFRFACSLACKLAGGCSKAWMMN